MLTAACLLGPLIGPVNGQQSRSTDSLARQISGWNLELDDLVPGAGVSNPARVRAILQERAAALSELYAADTKKAVELLLPQQTIDRLRSFAPPETLENRGKWDGVPEATVADDFEHHRSRTFWRMKTPEGRQFELFFAGRTPQPGLAIRVNGIQLGARVAVTDFVPLAGTTVQQCSTIGPQNIAVLMLTMPSALTFPAGYTQASLNEAFFGSSSDTSNTMSLNGFWKEMSYGQTSAVGQVFGPFALSQNYTCDQSDSLATAAIAAADGTVDFTRFTRIAMVWPAATCTLESTNADAFDTLGCVSVSSPSKGNLLESEGWFPAFPNNSPPPGLYAHELGHGLGLAHSSTEDYGNVPLGPLNVFGTTIEYGDPFALMGYPYNSCSTSGHYVAKHKSEILHWLSPNSDYQEVQSSGTYVVSPYETSGLRALRILRDPISDAWLWLEYRQPIGDVDSSLQCLTSNVFNGALIRYEDPTLDLFHTYLLDFNPVSTPNNFLSSALTPGQSWSDPYSLLTLKVNSANASGLSVSVQYDQPCASLQLSSSTFPATGGSGVVTVTAPANCAWTASSPVNWITFTGSVSGSGNGSVGFLVAANSTAQQQTAYLTVQRQSLAITQTGTSGLTVISVTPNAGSGSSATFTFQFGDTNGYNDINDVFVVFSDTYPNIGTPSCYISVYTGPWLVLFSDVAGGTTQGPMRLGQTGALSNNECTVYSAGSSISGVGNQLTVTLKISFQSSWAGAHSIKASLSSPVNVTGFIDAGVWTVPGGSSCISLSPASQSFPRTGGTGSFSVISTANCAWSAISGNPWISISSGASGTGDGTVSYSVAASSVDAPRTGTILIGGQAFAISQPGAFVLTTLAGGLPPPTALAGTAVTLASPQGLVSDTAGNVYFVSTPQSIVFKLDSTGTLTRVAGTGIAGYSGDGGAATAAALNQPDSIALDALGNLYIADTYNCRIRKVSVAGVISTIAGTGNYGFSGDGGAAISAWLTYPGAVAVGASGTVYISDTSGHRVRMIDGSGNISTIAGNGTPGYSGDGGPATSAMLNYPGGLAVDASGSVYICDKYNQRIRKVSGGVITTVAGNGALGFSGDGGPAASAMLSYPAGVVVDASGNLYIADTSNSRIRKVVTSGTITTVAGNGINGYSGDGGQATSSSLYWPQGVGMDASGNLWIADTSNGRVRKVSTSGIITTQAGGGSVGDGGPGAFAKFSFPQAVAVDNSGNTYVADTSGNRVRKISANGTITTVAGNGTASYSGDGGAATAASLNSPGGVAVDASGNLFIADSYNCCIRKVSSAGTITTFAGTYCGYSGDGGQAVNARLSSTAGIALDQAGNLYIADEPNQRVRKVSTAGIITTVAGNGSSGFSGDGGPAVNAQLSNPRGVAVDAAGNLFISDLSNFRIRKVGTDGNITTFAGTGSAGYSGDRGPATAATMEYPFGVAADGVGNVYLADADNNRIRVVSNAGTIDTVAGNGTAGFSGDGGPSASGTLNQPWGVAIDSSGRIYIADTYNSAIRVLIPTQTQPALSIQSTHTGNFTTGQSAAVYTVTVANSATAGATSGAVTVTETLPSALTLVSMAGSGWACQPATCTRSDSLAAGAAYPPITVTVTVAANAPLQLTNSVLVSGGGGFAAGAEDLTGVTISPSLSIAKTHAGNLTLGQTGATYTITVSNAASAQPTSGLVTMTETVPSGLTLISMAGTGWTCPAGGTTCTRSDALAGGASYPAITVTVNVASNAPSSFTNQVTVSGGGSATANASDTTTLQSATISGQVTVSGVGLSGVTINVNGSQTLSTTTDVSGNYSVSLPSNGTYTLAPARSGYSFNAPVTFSNLTVNQTANFSGISVAGLEFYPVTPCRVADTRTGAGFTGAFGPPSIAANTTRTFPIPSSSCGIPSTAAAYSFNFTVVPPGPLGVLTTWPTGQSMPNASTLNDSTGTVVANAAIVPAGTNGAINVYVNNTTDVLFDINGYFAPPLASGLQFYPVTPCRVADTRTGAGFTGAFGPPSMAAGTQRSFPIPSSNCGIPATAAAYSLNFTVVPPAPLGYLTTWPTGKAMPNASTLNSYTGTVVANAAIVPAGTGGAISIYVNGATDVLFDINGYFAPPAAGGLQFYPVSPCRIADTRTGAGFSGAFGSPSMAAGTPRSFPVPSSICEIPATAGAYSFNFTVVPPGPLGLLTTWPTGNAMPNASTLNSYNGTVVANAAIVPAGTGGAISIYVNNPTDVLFDINGYFSQ